MAQLRKTDRYVLHSQDHPDEVQVWKGEVNPSVTKTGVSVRFVGLEQLTASSPLQDPARPRRRGKHGRVLKLAKLDNTNNKHHFCSVPAPPPPASPEEPPAPRLAVALTGNRTLGASVEHRMPMPARRL
jgi:hypothetical protein